MESEHEQERDAAEAEDGEPPEFNAEDIEKDPAYNPEDSEHLKDLKGG